MTHTLPTLGNPDYPTSDGKPMAETDTHRELMTDLIETLDDHFANDPMVYVTGNILLHYVPGNRRKHRSPDVMVVKGVQKGRRLNYIVWEEGKSPDLVIELTSRSTRREDQGPKLELYRDVLKIPEYFLFDPYGHYLEPRFQGYRLRRGAYRPISWVAGRLPSEVLGLHLELSHLQLRLYDPHTGQRLPTRREQVARAVAALEQTETRALRAEAEVIKLKAELDALRRS